MSLYNKGNRSISLRLYLCEMMHVHKPIVIIISQYICQITVPYTLNLCSAIDQLYLSKIGKGKKMMTSQNSSRKRWLQHWWRRSLNQITFIYFQQKKKNYYITIMQHKIVELINLFNSFFQLKKFLIGEQLLYNVVLVSAIHQSGSAIRTHTSPPF